MFGRLVGLLIEPVRETALHSYVPVKRVELLMRLQAHETFRLIF